jgi:hypothetical protein
VYHSDSQVQSKFFKDLTTGTAPTKDLNIIEGYWYPKNNRRLQNKTRLWWQKFDFGVDHPFCRISSCPFPLIAEGTVAKFSALLTN